MDKLTYTDSPVDLLRDLILRSVFQTDAEADAELLAYLERLRQYCEQQIEAEPPPPTPYLPT